MGRGRVRGGSGHRTRRVATLCLPARGRRLRRPGGRGDPFRRTLRRCHLLFAPTPALGPIALAPIEAIGELRRTPLRNCPISPEGGPNLASQGTEAALSDPFGPRFTGRTHVRSVAQTPFRTVSRRSSVRPRYSGREFLR